MVEFSRYYVNFIRSLFQNIWKFITGIFNAFADLFFRDIVKYFQDLLNVSNAFGLIDWLIAFVVIVVNVAFIFFLGVKVYQFIRRYVKFAKKEIEKDELLEEISLLNQKTVELVEEKNKILALKVSNLGINPAGETFSDSESDTEDGKDKPKVPSRFVKLINVDEEYESAVTSVRMTDEDMVNLSDLVYRFINYAASQLGLFYKTKIIRAFFAGMATSKVLILEGISGTGKTSLPYAMGKFFKHDAYIISVQPSWRDRAEMIGYLNEFTKRFNETDFLRAVYETTYREDLNFIILDELNLARIEYYFAEFLSIMEMPDVNEWKIDIVPDSQAGDPKRMVNGKILISQNVWFIGTANKDDSTFTITDKVYDRATPIEINEKADYIDAPHTDNISMSYEYLNNLFLQADKDYPLSPKSVDNLAKLDDFVAKNFKITFGNRIMKQIKLFVPVYVACGGTELEALDYMVCFKIFRKFESLNLPFLQNELAELVTTIDKLFGKGVFVESINFINDLRKQF